MLGVFLNAAEPAGRHFVQPSWKTGNLEELKHRRTVKRKVGRCLAPRTDLGKPFSNFPALIVAFNNPPHPFHGDHRATRSALKFRKP